MTDLETRTEAELAKLYAQRREINAKLDADMGVNELPFYEEEALLNALDACCKRIDQLEEPRFANVCPCNF